MDRVSTRTQEESRWNQIHIVGGGRPIAEGDRAPQMHHLPRPAQGIGLPMRASVLCPVCGTTHHVSHLSRPDRPTHQIIRLSDFARVEEDHSPSSFFFFFLIHGRWIVKSKKWASVKFDFHFLIYYYCHYYYFYYYYDYDEYLEFAKVDGSFTLFSRSYQNSRHVDQVMKVDTFKKNALEGGRFVFRTRRPHGEGQDTNTPPDT